MTVGPRRGLGEHPTRVLILRRLSAGCPGVTTIVPDPDDLALSKVVAWRDKDRDWLRSGIRAKLFSLETMAAPLVRMPDRVPERHEMMRRLAWLAAECGLRSLIRE
ncbi:DUF6036 family nucleotidyltransferase [Methylobacterium sp. ARG-1]|uniref:DUF6036 family nucleotidyltransferase n=1 Tax=Methylobacterium sp. ARG-1 TaxID=1692501 RepID=UPI00329964E5